MTKSIYMAAYMKKRFHKARKRGLEMLGNRCRICGHGGKLEFDHIDPKSKTHPSGRTFYLGEKRFIAEMKKCQLLCRKCHGLKTLKDIGQKPARGTHGTLSAYRYCKCRICTTAHSRYSKEWAMKRRRALGIGPRRKATHGSWGMRKKCKCGVCRRALADYYRNYRAKLPR